MNSTSIGTLQQHLAEVKEGKRRFENAFQAVSRMIFEGGIEKVVVNSRTTYDFSIFRTGRKHPVGLYDEINSFVSFVKDAAEGGSSQEGNRRYTFRYVGMDRLGSYGRIAVIESQTYEDPLVLAMNLFPDPDDNRKFLAERI